MNTVVIFGAGATKACGGPLTNQILPQALHPTLRQKLEREGFLQLVDEFLVDRFHVPKNPVAREADDYPALPLLLSVIDMAVDRKQPMGPSWPVTRLQVVRRSLQYLIFALLEHELQELQHNHYADLLRTLDPTRRNAPTVISLNYDIIVDNTMVEIGGRLPDYGCDIDTDAYRSRPHVGRLLKIHGSLNWSYCPGCHRLDLGVSKSGRTYKMLRELYKMDTLEDRYSCHGFPCRQCSTFVEPILITPTQLKDYRNPHVMRVWLLAERALREAERVFIVGYSLPDDDLDVVYLLQRGLGPLAQRAPKNITVVERCTDRALKSIDKHPVGRRYRSIFGPKIDWRTDGFEGLVRRLRRSAAAPARTPRAAARPRSGAGR